MSVKENYEKIKKTVPSEVSVIAVVKHQTNDDITALYEAGQKSFAENKVQDFLEKAAHFSNFDMDWHFIGHLQRNKVKYIVDKVSLIHSLDSFRLAEEISKRSLANGIVMDCLIQVNTGDEEQKYGIPFMDCQKFLETLQDLEGIRIIGLMAVTPYSDDPEDARPYFKQMKELYDKISEIKYNNATMDVLSMGMSNDYQIAIEEGATMVRIGSLLFY